MLHLKKKTFNILKKTITSILRSKKNNYKYSTHYTTKITSILHTKTYIILKKKQLQAFYTIKKQLQSFYTIKIKKIIFSMFLSDAIGENKTFYNIIYLFIIW